MNERNVLEAFDLLLDELKGEIATVNRAGGAAQAAGHLAEAEQALARAKALGAIRQELEGIRERVKRLVGAPDPDRRAIKEDDAHATPTDSYRTPILHALVSLGGSAPVQAVLDHVEREMEGRFVRLDLDPLRSNPESVRWRNRAQWCRLRLKHEGLLRQDSARGVWEITEAGRKWLEEHS